MTKTVKQLWYGNLTPMENSGRNNREMRRLERQLLRNFEEFEGRLGEKDRETFQKCLDIENRYVCISNEQAFCDGFSLGTRLAFEALFSGNMQDE